MIPDVRETRDAALAARSAVIWPGLSHAARRAASERRPAEEDGHSTPGGGAPPEREREPGALPAGADPGEPDAPASSTPGGDASLGSAGEEARRGGTALHPDDGGAP